MTTVLESAPAPAKVHHLKTKLDENGSAQLMQVQAWLQAKRKKRVPLPEVVCFLLERQLFNVGEMATLQAELSTK